MATDQKKFVLYDKIPPNEPSKWKRIDKPEVFQAAMAHIIKQASRMTGNRFREIGGSQQSKQEALDSSVKDMLETIRKTNFIEYVVMRMQIQISSAFKPKGIGSATTSKEIVSVAKPNQMTPVSRPEDVLHVSKLKAQSSFDIRNSEDTPWMQARGGYNKLVLHSYGGVVFHLNNLTLGSMFAGRQKVVGDSAHIINMLAAGLIKIAPELKAAQLEDDFKLPIQGRPDVLLMMPMTMKEVWSGNLTPEQWMEKHLREPAQQYWNKLQTEPPLDRLMDRLHAETGLGKSECDLICEKISRNADSSAPGKRSYKLADMQRELRTVCQNDANGIRLLLQAQGLLSLQFPAPAVLVAETIESGADGNPMYMGASFNACNNRVETHFMNINGGERILLNKELLEGQWYMSTPVTITESAAS